MRMTTRWVAEICKYRTELKKPTLMVLIGNFCDFKELQVSKLEAESFAKNLNCDYIEVSARTGQGIDSVIFKSVLVYIDL